MDKKTLSHGAAAVCAALALCVALPARSAGASAPMVAKLLVADPNWATDLERSGARLTPKQTVGRGQAVVVVLMFSDPPKGAAGATIPLWCDVMVMDPTGAKSTLAAKSPCAAGGLASQTVHLGSSQWRVALQPGAPSGLWRVAAAMRDQNGNAMATAQTSFTYAP